MTEPTETVFIRLGEYERQEKVPSGFWEASQEIRREFILTKWPGASWIGNGAPGVWGISQAL